MLLALPAAMRAKDAFYIEPLNIVPGDTKTMTVSLDNASAYRGFQADLVLPEGLSLLMNSNGAFGISLTSRAAASFVVCSNKMSDGAVRIVCYSSQNDTLSGQSDALLTLQVKAAETFTGGSVQLRNVIFSNKENKDVEMDDSQVEVGVKEQNTVSVADADVKPGNRGIFSVLLSNESQITAYQFDLALPEGQTVDLTKCETTARCGSTHQLTPNDLGDGVVRFVCFSSDNTPFSGGQGSVLNLYINVGESVTGKQKAELRNIVLSDVNARTFKLDAVSFVVSATSVPLGDVNNDGVVNISDIASIVGYIMGDANTSFVEEAADVNGDGLINVSDIAGVVSLIVYGRTSGE